MKFNFTAYLKRKGKKKKYNNKISSWEYVCQGNYKNTVIQQNNIISLQPQSQPQACKNISLNHKNYISPQLTAFSFMIFAAAPHPAHSWILHMQVSKHTVLPLAYILYLRLLSHWVNLEKCVFSIQQKLGASFQCRNIFAPCVVWQQTIKEDLHTSIFTLYWMTSSFPPSTGPVLLASAHRSLTPCLSEPSAASPATDTHWCGN